MDCSQPCTPTLSTGPSTLTVVGPSAAWTPHKRLHGRTCGVSRDAAPKPTHPHRPITSQGDRERELQRRLDVPKPN
ncbi:hypothetical protein XpopCFBP1817_09570 [Xanthomonas populi]|uniref:Uncharacterized protein n=1 Tax=Xanthomonas populi TaxID=53414 RepID=A0A2S7EPY9_9XANT|nr:hypothetical protein XpopCFBP1817_09570 [Xanthomonas populi]